MKFWPGVAFLDLDELADVARIADACGYHGMMVSDHLVFPAELTSAYPYTATGEPSWDPATPWPDPWVLIGMLAGVTSHLRFATNIYVAASRNPFVTAKAVATAAVLSGERVALGVGAGWMREEFELLGTEFGNRGRRLDELVDVLRALWQGGMVAWHGRYYDFEAVQMSPVPDATIPIWSGGHSDAALRRAAHLDGWIGNAYTPEEASHHLSRLDAYRREAGTAGRNDYEVIIGLLARPDLDLYRRFEDAGVTGLLCAPWIGAAPKAPAAPPAGPAGPAGPGPSGDPADAAGGAAAAVAHRTASMDAKRAAIERFAQHFVAPLTT